MRLLLAEDDSLLGETIADALRAEGYAVDWFMDGSTVEAAITTGAYDLLVLDNRLPGKTGIQILQSARSSGCELPILMLTACNGVDDKVAGLDAGADDYLTKPFEIDELFARVRSLLRRQGHKNPVLVAGALAMNVVNREVSLNDEILEDLSAKEFAVLEILLRNAGRFVTKHRLLDGVTDWRDELNLNTIEVYISRLRKRLGAGVIETLRGVGYRVNR